jgi:hypothetical protein
LGHATNLEESTDLMGYGWPDLGDPVLSDCDLDALAFVFAWALEGVEPYLRRTVHTTARRAEEPAQGPRVSVMEQVALGYSPNPACRQSKPRMFAELLIDCEEDRTLGAVLVGDAAKAGLRIFSSAVRAGVGSTQSRTSGTSNMVSPVGRQAIA